MRNKKFFRKAMAILLVFAMFASMPLTVWANTPEVVNINGSLPTLSADMQTFLAALRNPRVHTINWTLSEGGSVTIQESFTIPPGVTVNITGFGLGFARGTTVTNSGTINAPSIAVGETLINTASGRINTGSMSVPTDCVVNNYGTISVSGNVTSLGTINNHGTFFAGGTVAPTVTNNDPVPLPQHGQLLVTIVPAATQITFTATVLDGTSGTANSTQIELEFSENISDLPEGSIAITHGTGNAFVESVSGSGDTWIVNITNVTQGTAYVAVEDFGTYEFDPTPQQVTVFAVAPPPPPHSIVVTVEPPQDPVEITTAGTTSPGKQFIATAFAANGTTVVTGVRFAWTLRDADDGTDITAYLQNEHSITISETGLLVVPANATPNTEFYVRATFAGWQ